MFSVPESEKMLLFLNNNYHQTASNREQIDRAYVHVILIMILWFCALSLQEFIC